MKSTARCHMKYLFLLFLHKHIICTSRALRKRAHEEAPVRCSWSVYFRNQIPQLLESLDLEYRVCFRIQGLHQGMPG